MAVKKNEPKQAQKSFTSIKQGDIVRVGNDLWFVSRFEVSLKTFRDKVKTDIEHKEKCLTMFALPVKEEDLK